MFIGLKPTSFVRFTHFSRLRFKVENAGKSRSSQDRFGHSRESNRRGAVLCALEPAFNSLSLPLNVAVELVVTAIVKPD